MIRISTPVKLAATTVAAVVATTVPSAGAFASSQTPGDFSSVLDSTSRPNPRVSWVGDCRAEAGIVYDSVPYPNYRHIAGVRVNCYSRHSYISAQVGMYFWNGRQWVLWGSTNSGTRYNSYGSGAGMIGILRSPATCVGSYRGYYWAAIAYVRTESAASWVYSNYYTDPSGGC